MNLRENIKESLRSVLSNKLRSALTIATTAVGITCLVGMLTAVEAMRQNYLNEYARLGVNSFTIHSVNNWRRRRNGLASKNVPRISYAESQAFERLYNRDFGIPGVRMGVTGASVLSRASKKTHPNIRISGVDDNYLRVEYLELDYGRNFTSQEVDGGAPVAIIGNQAYENLYEKGQSPVDTYIVAYGTRYRVIGKLKKLGDSDRGKDRFFLIPLQQARRLSRRRPWMEIVVAAHDLSFMDEALGEGIRLMRSIRRDGPSQEDSFETERSSEAEEGINQTMSVLRAIGYIIGTITLIGACVGLMNIMFIYVRERTKEIGLRKAVGATAQKIRLQFLTESVVVCQLGGVAGIVFGLIVGNLTALAMSASFTFPFGPISLGVIVSTLVGVIAGYIPASNAAKVDPIESLRYE